MPQWTWNPCCYFIMDPTAQRLLNDLQRAMETFSRSYDFALRRPPPVSKLDRRHTGRLRKRDKLLTGEGGKRVSEGPVHMTGKKAWSSINHSVVSSAAQALHHITVFFYHEHVADIWHLF